MKLSMLLPLFFIILAACSDKPNVITDLSSARFNLMNSRNEKISFPEAVRGRTVVLNFIYTNCPDICPLTTNNMRLIQAKLLKEKCPNVEFVSISFDPENDSPEVLSKFSSIRNLDLGNWMFLTGSKSEIDSLIKTAGIIAVKDDSTIFKDGRKMVFYTHTDRISLMDNEGKIRMNYTGSKINIDEIVRDIKLLN